MGYPIKPEKAELLTNHQLAIKERRLALFLANPYVALEKDQWTVLGESQGTSNSYLELITTLPLKLTQRLLLIPVEGAGEDLVTQNIYDSNLPMIEIIRGLNGKVIALYRYKKSLEDNTEHICRREIEPGEIVTCGSFDQDDIQLNTDISFGLIISLGENYNLAVCVNPTESETTFVQAHLSSPAVGC